MLKVAYLVSRYPAISHTFILREVRELRSLGMEIETISINPPDRPLERLGEVELSEARRTFVLKGLSRLRILVELLREAVTSPLRCLKGLALAMRLGGGSFKATLWRLFYLVEAILVGRRMRERGSGHLHVHFATQAATVALLTSRVFATQFSMTVHGPDEFYDVSEFHLREKIEAAAFICTIGSYCKSQLMKLSEPRDWAKMHVAPLGVDPEVFRPAGLHGPAAGEFQILCVGRLVPAKGQAVLLDAVASLIGEGRKIHLTLAGDGPDRERLEAAAERLGLTRHCSFPGAVNPDRVRELYETTQLFVLASFAEGIPVVLMEAMAMELPCISSFVDGIPELIESGKEGLLVCPADTQGLSEAIARAIDDAAFARSLGKAARRKVIARYNLGPNVAYLRSIFGGHLQETA
jgi:colanic acid/amylovoran biosynthesis glycosyltransferase